MNAILAEIAEKNLSGATVRGIAKRLGISHGSLFHYFQSKEAMVDELTSSGYLQQDRLFLSELTETGSAVEKLMKIASFALGYGDKNPQLIAFWVELSLPANEKYSEYNISGELEAIEQIKSIIEGGVESGEFGPGADTAAAAFFFDNTVSGLLRRSVSKQEKLKFNTFFGGLSDDQILSSLESSLRSLLSAEK